MRFHLVAAALAALAATSSHAADDTTTTLPENPYITLQVQDASNFCTFLPPADSENRNIADTEYIANVFCLGNNPLAKSAGQMADGFIQSAHYLATDDYVQVTGQIDPAKANLNVTDEGGQYDIVMPKGAVCAGNWKHFVNLIEPAGRTYCIRCCHSKVDCNRGISEKGCAHIIPGDYSGPENGIAVTTSNPSSAAPQSSIPATAAVSSPASAASASPAASSSSGNSNDESVSAQSVDEDKESSSALTRPAIATGVVGLILSAVVLL
ncbi:hypothetical protein BDB00DRAFT_866050 [Zychaea mexicana]|uniref:uncharacterized protein n=1 Tax=Zychaea mexicana TaxID=64656 RepID=UPI0022FF15A6|nr:uncharacterized protein BDB00DRAFT_866050 [Zychaea mexicana]KAI9466389.1 hypothetical protein BDB00DRAFT_866050 [Zychaea mexicana]